MGAAAEGESHEEEHPEHHPSPLRWHLGNDRQEEKSGIPIHTGMPSASSGPRPGSGASYGSCLLEAVG